MSENYLKQLCSRRSVLRSLALGAGGVAFAGSLGKRRSRGGAWAQAADTATAPKRLLVLYNPNGIRYENGGRDWVTWGTSETDFALSDITLPLKDLRDQLVFFENLSFGMTASWGDTHRGGRKAALTAAKLVQRDGETGDLALGRPSGPSIDQFLGQALGRRVTPKWPSLLLNLLGYGSTSEVSFDANGASITPYESPWIVYEKMFSELVDPSGTTDPGLLHRVLRRQSVLDVVHQDLARFRRRLPSEDQERADAQLAAIRTLEERLVDSNVPDSCTPPELGQPLDPRKTNTYPQLLRATSDLCVAAFACDLTRFAVIEARSSFRRAPSDFPPINGEHYEHHYSHEDPLKFAQLKAFYMNEVAYIASRLQAIPEGNGTMLDNTVILWTTEISTGHSHARMPWMTVGGQNLGVRTGRALKLPAYYQNPVEAQNRRYNGYPHRRLLVSLIEAMGVDATGFGDPMVPGEPMEGFRA